MEAQLRLLSAPEPAEPGPRDERVDDAPVDDAPALEEGPVAWRLSSSTRELGREGIEHARAALRRARPADRSSEPLSQQRPSAA